MAGQVSVDRQIAAPPGRVWEMVVDVTRMGEWSPESAGASWLGGATRAAPGARFRGRNRIGWRRWSTTCRVVDATPGERFAFRVTTGPLEVAEWSYTFEPTEGGCRVTEAWTDERGSIVRTLSKLVTGVDDRIAHNRAGMEQTLDRLKAAAEDA